VVDAPHVRRGGERQPDAPEGDDHRRADEDGRAHPAPPDPAQARRQRPGLPDQHGEHDQLGRQPPEEEHPGSAAVVLAPLDLRGGEVVARIEVGERERRNLRLPEERSSAEPHGREGDGAEALR
jgi:hypothetical protein